MKGVHTLFLDFDGVLHPDAVFLSSKGPMLNGPGDLFMWSSHLSGVLASFPSVSLVLSTSWVRHLGFNRAVKALPPAIATRVIGATWHSTMEKGWLDEQKWDGSTRYNQICRYAARANLSNWVALDDDTEGWLMDSRQRLVACDPTLGMSDINTQQNLATSLTKLVSGTTS